MNYNKWLNHTFSSSSYPLEDYIEFQKEMKKDLKKMAKKENLVLHSFNKNHYEFTAVIKDVNTDNCVYISISDVRFFKNAWYDNVLVRRMKHERDWIGGSNMCCKWIDVGKKAKELLSNFNEFSESITNEKFNEELDSLVNNYINNCSDKEWKELLCDFNIDEDECYMGETRKNLSDAILEYYSDTNNPSYNDAVKKFSKYFEKEGIEF
ncbi:MAG: hypothetical protein Q4G04_04895 [bacterium]|nr:hypothetical protein [bacterium]